MATSAQIKSDNNTLIRVKTTAKSITKVNVADQLDAGIDYTVQELALKVDKVAGKSLISDTEINRLASVTQTPAKTNGSVTAIGGSKATLEFDINTVSKSGGSDVKLPTTTDVGKEVLFLASNYLSTVNVYVNDAEDIKLSGGSNGVSGNQQSLQINANEAYRFIYRTNGYWYFEKIIDIPTNYYQLISERTTDGTLATNSNFKYPTERAVKTYVDANAGVVLKTSGIVSAGTSLPYPQTTFDITLVNTVAINSRVLLKNATPVIGTVYRIINIGAFTIYVKASALTDGVFAIAGLKNDKTEEVKIEVNGEYDFTYIDLNTWLVNAVNDSKLQPLEYTCQLYQAGIANVIPQSIMIDTLIKNYDGGSRFVDVVFSRLGIGDYYCRVRYSGLSLDPTKLAVFFGDATCRVYSSSTGNDGANYKQWNFKTYTELGVVSDDILQGNNGTFINIKLYR